MHVTYNSITLSTEAFLHWFKALICGRSNDEPFKPAETLSNVVISNVSNVICVKHYSAINQQGLFFNLSSVSDIYIIRCPVNTPVFTQYTAEEFRVKVLINIIFNKVWVPSALVFLTAVGIWMCSCSVKCCMIVCEVSY